MKKTIITLLSLLVISTSALSHSGRTDSAGGHNCSQKSINKGLCDGYHYHYHNGVQFDDLAKGHEGHGEMEAFKLKNQKDVKVKT